MQQLADIKTVLEPALSVTLVAAGELDVGEIAFSILPMSDRVEFDGFSMRFISHGT